MDDRKSLSWCRTKYIITQDLYTYLKEKGDFSEESVLEYVTQARRQWVEEAEKAQ